MKGISSLLIVALVASVYGDSLEKSEWEALEKLRQENASRKEKVLSFLREIGKGQPTENEKYNEFPSRSKDHEVENDDRNIEKWRPGIPENILSLIKKYKLNSPNGDDPCKGDQTKNQKNDHSDDWKDSEDSNVDIDGEDSDQNKEESPIKNHRRRSTSREDKSSSDEDDSNSLDDNSSDEELRRSHRGNGKSKEKNSDESNSDKKSNNSDSDEKDSRGSRKDKPRKKNSDESNSDDNSDNSNDDKKNLKKRRENKSKEKNSNESNSDETSDDSDSDEKDRRDSRKEKPKKKNSDESDSDNKSDDSDSNKSKKDEDDESENSSEEKKWRWILDRGDHQANNKTPAPWNWQPKTIWELEAKRAELKSRLIGIAKLEKVIKLLKNRTDEFKKRGQWERTPGLVKAIAVNQKLLAENINAVSRICNITEVEPNKIFELIIKCAINYSSRWRKSSHAGRPILESKKAILNNGIPLQEFLAAHRNLNRTYITQILNAKGLIVKEGEQVNGIISWKSQLDKSVPPSDNAGAIEKETSLNSMNSSDNKKNGPGANVDESAVLDKNQAPETSPANGKGNEHKNLNDQPDSNPVQIKPESSSAGGNGVNPSNNENEIPGSNDYLSANDVNQPPQSVPKSDEPENLDLKPEVSSSSDNTAKEIATADKNSWSNRKKSVNDIIKLGVLNVDRIAGSANLAELLVGQAESSIPKNVTDEGQNKDNSDWEVGESSTDNNNQTTPYNETDTTLGSNETSDDTSSQTGSTTTQTEQSSETSENTDTTEPNSALPTEGTTDTVQNVNSESESIFNTTAPKSTSLTDE